MIQGPLFLSIKDMMKLMGTENYHSAFKRHKSIRDAIKKGKRGLLIQEFCDYEGFQFEAIWKLIR